ncbi:phosphoribosylanthranilate isomerase [Brevundimonas sp. VNH65]|uniref:phosphoribosylanthranilate isomerase n=1 Tax=Brevundimonas sp. VNH65 TaxID=3400917 RepID=UPI003C121327
MTLIKICGLTTADTLAAALDHGADFVGAVVFPRSPRHIAPVDAASLFEAARGRARIVAVTVNPDDDLLSEIARTLRPDFLQLHGDEPPERARAVRRLTGAGVIKALPIRSEADFGAADAWQAQADHLMFDARPPEGSTLPGGVGHSFDWRLLADRSFARPWFLAGGLTPENLADALAVTRAPMADVSSGVETAPGVKDAGRIGAFIQTARRT